MRNLTLAIGVVAMLAAGAGWAATHETKAKPLAHARTPEQALARAVTPTRLKAHLSALEAIARRNGGTRAVGTRGYTQSVDYVVKQLRKAGYRPRKNMFSFEFFRETRPTVFDRVAPGFKHYTSGPDFITMRYSGGGNVTAQVVPVDLSSTSGCESGDFARFPAGAIALMRRGGCPFSQKAGNAESHAAAGALIANDGLPGRTAPLSA